ncbi:uncharacterized protein LOC128878703 isoform X2 [Hylaeus volcanicus]|uniref:uncharacterized protein LOC128878703 isoform X2 n=1 Tax=Hylaeus volcanicus TaxID=313075 RepID=UPI0023B7756D|nr:uncharacterized protein LOC128878703 isoform X2 [Hylaeus volcanicus]
MVKLVVTLLAVFCIVNFVDSAAVKSEEFAEQLRRIVHDAYPDNLRIQRATESGRDSSKRNCYDTPCGWNAYNPQTRQTTIFMPNTFYYKEYRYVSENIVTETVIELCALSPNPDFYRLFCSWYTTSKVYAR